MSLSARWDSIFLYGERDREIAWLSSVYEMRSYIHTKDSRSPLSYAASPSASSVKKFRAQARFKKPNPHSFMFTTWSDGPGPARKD